MEAVGYITVKELKGMKKLLEEKRLEWCPCKDRAFKCAACDKNGVIGSIVIDEGWDDVRKFGTWVHCSYNMGPQCLKAIEKQIGKIPKRRR